jgi:transposase
MAKQAIYLQEAERRYVQEGMGLDAIVGILGKNVSRKTLYNWKEQYDWDGRRRAFLEQTKDLRSQLYEYAMQRFQEARTNPSIKAFKLAMMAFEAVVKYGDKNLLAAETTPEQREQMKKMLSPESMDFIKSLYGLR